MALFDDHPSELSDELLSFLESSDSYPLDDIFFTKTDHLPSFHHHPSFSDPSYTPREPREPLDLYHRHAKRPKSCNDLHKPVELMFEANSYNAANITEPSPCSWTNAPEFSSGKKVSREWSSAQSVAARDRRKRISEKTQELARLIPGGNKMNTSEMLQAAFNYVKFLQSQVSVLALMQSFESLKVSSMDVEEQLQVLLSSNAMQQRLASESKCIIPIEFVEFLVEEEVVENSFKRFIETIGL